MGEGCHRALLARGAPRGRVGQRVGERERARADALAGAGVGAPDDCEGQRAGRAGGTRGMARAAAREYGGVRVSVAYVLFIAAIATAAFHMGVIAAGRRGTLEPRAAAEQALVARARPDIERRELSVTGAVRGARASRGPSSSEVGEGWATGGGGGVRVISWAPRASVWRGFLSDAEADTIVARARPLMERSRVVSETGEGVESKARTSRGAFLPRHNVSDIRKVEDRIGACLKERERVCRTRNFEASALAGTASDPAPTCRFTTCSPLPPRTGTQPRGLPCHGTTARRCKCCSTSAVRNIPAIPIGSTIGQAARPTSRTAASAWPQY